MRLTADDLLGADRNPPPPDTPEIIRLRAAYREAGAAQERCFQAQRYSRIGRDRTAEEFAEYQAFEKETNARFRAYRAAQEAEKARRHSPA